MFRDASEKALGVVAYCCKLDITCSLCRQNRKMYHQSKPKNPPYRDWSCSRQRWLSKLLCNHVSTKDNSADIVSRGLIAKELIDCEQWWYGLKSWRPKTSENAVLATLPAVALTKFNSWRQISSVTRCAHLWLLKLAHRKAP